MSAIESFAAAEIVAIEEAGLFKTERVLQSAQQSEISAKQPSIETATQVVNFCANNYLGLANHPDVVAAARDSLDAWGFGCASVRFICGTQAIHKQLENVLSEFLGQEDTILYNSCWDANGGLFETLLGPEDAILSDELNHASIIDGIRLCKARRYRYKNNDMDDLRAKLEEAKDARFRLIATDGVFSMDGYIADLPSICQLADDYDAAVMVDDSHAVGFVGKRGRGTPEHHGVMDRIDILTGTLGKALGGASGGYTASSKSIVELLRQRSRTYLFSNSVAPPIVAGSLKAIELLQSSTELRDQLEENTAYFRDAMTACGFEILPGTHPIAPIMIGDAALATRYADALLQQGIYVIGFSYPVVPKGKARVRTQISAAHTKADLDRAIEAFTNAGKELGII